MSEVKIHGASSEGRWLKDNPNGPGLIRRNYIDVSFSYPDGWSDGEFLAWLRERIAEKSETV